MPGATYGARHRRRSTFAENGIELLARFTHVGHNIGLETEEQWLDDSPGRVVEPAW